MTELSAYLFALSLALTLAALPICMRLSRRWGVLDVPGPRKIHLEPTPLCGGWAIFGVVTLVVWGHFLAAAFLPPSWVPQPAARYAAQTPSLALKYLPVYGGLAAMFLLGLWDDLRGLSVRSRFWIQVAVAAALALAGFRPHLGFLPSWVSGLLGAVWIVGITNAFNFLDGLDGLSAGVALTGTAGLLSLMGLGNQPDWAFLLAVQAGALLGFLRYNWSPARAFLGSAGSLSVGYLMAMSTLMVTYSHGQKAHTLIPILTPIFLMTVPLYDTTSVVLLRLLKRRHIAIGDQSHFHHRLLRLGFSPKQAAAFMILMSGAFALSAVQLVDASLRQALLALGQVLILLMILILAERAAAKVRAEVLKRRSNPSTRVPIIQP